MAGAVKLLISAGLLLFLAQAVDWTAVTAAFARLDFVHVAGAAALIALQCALLGWRWHRIVGQLGGVLPVRDALRWTVVGIFFNQALPSSVGGDAIRIWMLRRRSGQTALAVGSVLVERVTGLMTLAVIVSACAWQLADPSPSSALMALRWVGPTLVAGVLVTVAVGIRMAPWLPARVAEPLERTLEAFRAMTRRGSVLLEVIAWGVASNVSGLLAAWVLTGPLGITVDLVACMALVGGAVLLTVLPITVGGWGLREVAIASLFLTVGSPRESAVAMSIVWGALPVLVSAPFAMAWWLSRPPEMSNRELEERSSP